MIGDEACGVAQTEGRARSRYNAVLSRYNAVLFTATGAP